jgi:hypothetical protein
LLKHIDKGVFLGILLAYANNEKESACLGRVAVEE